MCYIVVVISVSEMEPNISKDYLGILGEFDAVFEMALTP
jgi:hypothetical protein